MEVGLPVEASPPELVLVDPAGPNLKRARSPPKALQVGVGGPCSTEPTASTGSGNGALQASPRA